MSSVGFHALAHSESASISDGVNLFFMYLGSRFLKHLALLEAVSAGTLSATGFLLLCSHVKISPFNIFPKGFTLVLY